MLHGDGHREISRARCLAIPTSMPYSFYCLTVSTEYKAYTGLRKVPHTLCVFLSSKSDLHLIRQFNTESATSCVFNKQTVYRFDVCNTVAHAIKSTELKGDKGPLFLLGKVL